MKYLRPSLIVFVYVPFLVLSFAFLSSSSRLQSAINDGSIASDSLLFESVATDTFYTVNDVTFHTHLDCRALANSDDIYMVFGYELESVSNGKFCRICEKRDNVSRETNSRLGRKIE
jgi:hypothetical protein